MTETLTKIAGQYEAVAPNVTITYNFDSSGTLKTQIQEGAACDVFISAAPKQMNALDAESDRLMHDAFEALGLSARSHDRILRVARTIADLAGSEAIRREHLFEAIGYRALDRSLWT